MQKEILKDIKTLVVAVVLTLGVFTVSAWNGPISTPPNGNGYAPINTTSNSQTKQGSLWTSGFFTTGGGYFGGDVGIGTQSPEARLDVRNGSCYYKLQSDGFYTNCLLNTPTLLTISSDTANYNIATALGNPTTPKNVILTINSGITVYSNSTSQASLDTSNLPSGSTVKIINNGLIVGRGGNGGFGGGHCWLAVPTAGGNGGDAINATVAVFVDNTNGYIYGAGGGGGGSGSSCASFAGGSGGGGAGYGAGGSSTSWFPAAESGTATAGGAGRQGHIDSYGYALTGGNGGGPGENGSNGATSGSPGTAYPGAAGGLAGKAINLNGQTITWLGGNNGSQVKGAVQ